MFKKIIMLYLLKILPQNNSKQFWKNITIISRFKKKYVLLIVVEEKAKKWESKMSESVSKWSKVIDWGIMPIASLSQEVSIHK